MYGSYMVVSVVRDNAEGTDKLATGRRSRPESVRYSTDANNHVIVVQRLSLPTRDDLSCGLALLSFVSAWFCQDSLFIVDAPHLSGILAILS